MAVQTTSWPGYEDVSWPGYESTETPQPQNQPFAAGEVQPGQVNQPPTNQTWAQTGQGLLSALGAGVQASTAEWGQLGEAVNRRGAGDPAGQTDWRAQPTTWSDWFTHPFTVALPKTLYQTAESSPELGAGIAGAAAGEFVEPAGGGILGGALAAGGMHMIHKLGPYYAAELHADPAHPDDALARAAKQAVADGAISAASWGAFGAINPFKRMASNLLLQTFGVQPALAMAGTGVHDVVAGQWPGWEDFEKQMGQSYLQGSAGTFGPAAGLYTGHIANGLLGHVFGGAKEAIDNSKPLHQQLEETADHFYSQLDNAGPLRPEYMRGLADTIRYNLIDDGMIDVDPKAQTGGLDRRIHGWLDMLGDQGTSMDRLGRIRSNLSKIERTSNDDFTASQARAMKGMLDDFTSNPDQLLQAGVNGDQVDAVAKAGRLAARFYAGEKQVDLYHDMANKIATYNQQDPWNPKAWQTEAKRIVANPKQMKKYGPEAQQTLRDMVNLSPDSWQQTLAGHLEPTSLSGMLRNALIGGMFGYAFGGLADAAEAAGFGGLGENLKGTFRNSLLHAAKEKFAAKMQPLAEGMPENIAEGIFQGTGVEPLYPVTPRPTPKPKWKPPRSVRPLQFQPVLPAGQQEQTEWPGYAAGGRAVRAYRLSARRS